MALKNFSKDNIQEIVLLGFQQGHSTDHATVQIADQIHNMFNKNIYAVDIFINLSKAFESVTHKIFLRKLSHYGI